MSIYLKDKLKIVRFFEYIEIICREIVFSKHVYLLFGIITDDGHGCSSWKMKKIEMHVKYKTIYESI